MSLMAISFLINCGGSNPEPPQPEPTTKAWYEHDDWWNYCSNGVEGEEATANDIGREVNLTVNKQIHKIRLIDIDHDNLAASNNKAHCTFEFANLLSDENGYSIATVWNWENAASSKNFDYLDSNLRKAIDGSGEGSLVWYEKDSPTASKTYIKSALEMLPSDLKKTLKTVIKPIALYSGKDLDYVVDNEFYETQLFILSYREMSASGASYAKDEGSAYQYYTGAGDTNDNRIKHQVKWHDQASENYTTITDGKYSSSFNYAGYNSTIEKSGGYYWLRSPCTYRTSTTIRGTEAWDSSETGALAYGMVYRYAFPIAPAFCI